MELNVKVGKLLFRSPSSNTKSGIFGNFYSTKKVAKGYINGVNVVEGENEVKKVYKFKIIKTLKLLDFSSIKTFEFLDTKFKEKPFYEQFQKFTGYGLTTLHIRYKFKDKTKDFDRCVYKNKNKYEPRICDYLEDPSNPSNYLHKKLALEICKLGYDGYYMPEKYIWANVITRTILFEKEFFICDPTEVLENLGPI